MVDNPLLAVGILLVASFFGGRAANAVKLPRISGYLLAGMVLSSSFLGIMSRDMVNRDLSPITEVSLGVIAFSIGGSLVYQHLRHLGRNILWITVVQAAGAFLITAASLVILLPVLTDFGNLDLEPDRVNWAVALVIGAISAATAPGAVLAIISELRARGPFIQTLLGVIALDDGLTIILFALAGAVAVNFLNPDSVSIYSMALHPAIEISTAITLGLLSGTGLKYSAKLARRRETVIMAVFGCICITSGAAVVLHTSPLLANMVAGFFVANFESRHQQLFHSVEQVEEPIFGLFFSLAGAHLDLSVLKAAGFLAVTILIVRMVGKQLGTWVGARISNASATVRRYLGMGLFPQAGVTVGLVLLAEDFFPREISDIVVNAVIGSVILNELIAPPMVTYVIKKARESI
ncbi:MAG TPA: cation:proton antiporter [Thermodesulfobacteriaceae bacterium]|nr:cation:proton antiporter [Thermodesulfobacteriaceae bacterium]